MILPPLLSDGEAEIPLLSAVLLPAVRFWHSWERIPDSWERMRRSPRSLPGFSGSLTRSLLSLREISDSLLRIPVSLWGFFRKPTSPPLPLREGPPLISVFSPQGRRGNRSSSSLVTISFYGWRTIRGLRQQQNCGLRYATAWTRRRSCRKAISP